MDTKQNKKHSPLFFVCILIFILAATVFTVKNNLLTKLTGKSTAVSSESVDNQSKAWGPDRTMFSWDMRADYATINSIYDNPVIGDERNFVRIRKAGTNDTYKDTVVAEPGAEYEIWIFFHNNANSQLNDSTGRTFAQNIRVRVDPVPSNMSKGDVAMIKGIISTTNSTPAEVWDTAYIRTEEAVSLRYVRGSVRLHNGSDLHNQRLDDEALFGKKGGAFVGYDQWGLLPGGEQYSGNVTFRIKVDKAGFSMDCTVSKENANDYRNEIEAVPGEILDFKIYFRNTGTTLIKNVMSYDLLGEGLEFVPGTTKIFNAAHPEGGVEKDNLFKNGFIIGDYGPGRDAALLYKVKISDDKTIFPYGQTVIVENNAATGTNAYTIHDKVHIKVRREYDPASN